MKKLTAFVCASTLTLITASALANNATTISKAHYGKPSPTVTQGIGKTNITPFTITNNTDTQYYVTLTQANGHTDCNMPIQSVYNNPYNVISLDNPAWPVHVDVSDYPGDAPFMSEDVYPDQPNATIDNSTTTYLNTKMKVTFKVSK